MKKLITVLMTLCCLIFGCVSAFAQSAYIEAKGYGSPAEFSLDQDIEYQKNTAYEAAKMEAYAALLERINGVQVDSRTTVKNLRLADRIIETKVQGFVQNADVVDTQFNGTSCVVTMRINLYNEENPQNSLASAVMPQNYTPQPMPTSSNSVIAKEMALTPINYSGVIIDCSGLGLKSAMSPVIKDDTGKNLYGYKNLDPKFICKYGMAGYTEDVADASRAGDTPLVIKAVSLENGVNPVLSAADADRMLQANQKTHFLDRCCVVFVK